MEDHELAVAQPNLAQ